MSTDAVTSGVSTYRTPESVPFVMTSLFKHVVKLFQYILNIMFILNGNIFINPFLWTVITDSCLFAIVEYITMSDLVLD